MAAQCARQALEASALDHGSDEVAFRKDLINIARTTLSSKILTTSKQFFAELAVNSVLRLKGKK
jgi:T-complex protein 1 subunit beta